MKKVYCPPYDVIKMTHGIWQNDGAREISEQQQRATVTSCFVWNRNILFPFTYFWRPRYRQGESVLREELQSNGIIDKMLRHRSSNENTGHFGCHGFQSIKWLRAVYFKVDYTLPSLLTQIVILRFKTQYPASTWLENMTHIQQGLLKNIILK